CTPHSEPYRPPGWPTSRRSTRCRGCKVVAGDGIVARVDPDDRRDPLHSAGLVPRARARARALLDRRPHRRRPRRRGSSVTAERGWRPRSHAWSPGTEVPWAGPADSRDVGELSEAAAALSETSRSTCCLKTCSLSEPTCLARIRPCLSMKKVSGTP